MTPARCPSCDARCRPEDTWCTLCHARLDEAAPDDTVTQETVAQEPATQETVAQEMVTVHATVGSAVSDAVLDDLVASLAAQERGLGLPGIAGLTAERTATRGGQAMVATAGVGVVLVVLLVAMTVLGHFV